MTEFLNMRDDSLATPNDIASENAKSREEETDVLFDFLYDLGDTCPKAAWDAFDKLVEKCAMAKVYEELYTEEVNRRVVLDVVREHLANAA